MYHPVTRSLSVLSLAVLAACAADRPTTAPELVPTVPSALYAEARTGSSISLHVKDTVQLITRLRNRSVRWTSSDPSVASVSTRGQVIGRQTGAAVITASNSSGTERTNVTVAGTERTLQSLTLSPGSGNLTAGQTLQFAVSALWSDGTTTPPSVTYTATGGTISVGGLYTAGQIAGAFMVIANCEACGGKADTSFITVASVSAPTLQSIAITPKTTSLSVGATQQFSATARWSDGSTTVPALVYTANGGVVSATGAYTAPATTGTYRVVVASQGVADTATVSVVSQSLTSLTIGPKGSVVTAGGVFPFYVTATWSNGSKSSPAATLSASVGSIQQNGLYTAPLTLGTYKVYASFGGRVDSTTITVQAPPPLGNPAGLVKADYFTQYANTAAFQSVLAAKNFYGTDNIDVQLASIDPNVTYKGHPTMRYDFPSSTAATPMLVVPVRNLTNMWFRVKVRFSPGFTTTGEFNGVVTAANPTGYRSANAYKFLSWGWHGLNGRGEIMITNTDEYQNLVDVFPPDYPNRGSMQSITASQQRITTEWSDGGWYDYIIHYEILTPFTARQRFWFVRDGSTPVLRATSNLTALPNVPLPFIDRVQLGRNFNQLRLPTQYMYLWYGQWEVYDGTQNPNPFGVP